MTFDELCRGTTAEEREQIVWRLAEIRYRNTIRALLPRGEIVNPHVLPYAAEPKQFPVGKTEKQP